MRNLFYINSVLVSINIVLGFTIFLGLYFLIILGVAQVLMSLIIAYNKKQLTKDIRYLFTIYTVITITILTGVLLMYLNPIPTSYTLLYLGLITSVTMAFLHLYITFLINKL